MASVPAESHVALIYISFFKKTSPKDMFIAFRERGKGRSRERQTDIDQLLPICAPTRDQTCNLGMCPDQESNPQPLGAQDNTPTS